MSRRRDKCSSREAVKACTMWPVRVLQCRTTISFLSRSTCSTWGYVKTPMLQLLGTRKRTPVLALRLEVCKPNWAPLKNAASNHLSAGNEVERYVGSEAVMTGDPPRRWQDLWLCWLSRDDISLECLFFEQTIIVIARTGDSDDPDDRIPSTTRRDPE